MKVIVCVDDSPFSDAAVNYVAAIPGAQKMQVIVLAVGRSPVVLSTDLLALELGPDKELVKKETLLHQRIADRAEVTLRAADIQAETRVVLGDPREKIIEVLASENADLVVVGSHGRTGISKLLMGSVAASVISHAPCSVLVVKRRAAE